MSLKPCATFHALRPALVRASLLAAMLAVLGVIGSTGCEDQAIGRPCDVLADAGALQAVFNAQALECPSRICLKPVRQPGVVRPVNTVAYCSAECSKDSDCEGESRDQSNGRDRRCETGFVCGVAFEVGPLCCKKLCLCKDFLEAGTMKKPLTCDTAAGGRGCQ